MVVEMVKLDICTNEVLQLLTENDLTYQVVNEIYQRGLLNKLVATLTEHDLNERQAK